MLEFDTYQLNSFADAFRTSFMQDTAMYLKGKRPAWAAGQTQDQLYQHVEQAMEFAKAHDLKTAASIQKLALIKIDLDFEDDPGSYARMLLRARHWSEERRVANYLSARRSDPALKRIRLGR